MWVSILNRITIDSNRVFMDSSPYFPRPYFLNLYNVQYSQKSI